MKIMAAEQQARRRALDAAERSGVREGLPPVSDYAREIGARYAVGELTADQAIAFIIKYHEIQSTKVLSSESARNFIETHKS